MFSHDVPHTGSVMLNANEPCLDNAIQVNTHIIGFCGEVTSFNSHQIRTITSKFRGFMSPAKIFLKK